MPENPFEAPTTTQSTSSTKQIDYAGLWSFIATFLQPVLFAFVNALELRDQAFGFLMFQYILLVASGMVLGFNSSVRTLNGKRLAYYPVGLVGFAMSFACVFGFPLLTGLF